MQIAWHHAGTITYSAVVHSPTLHLLHKGFPCPTHWGFAVCVGGGKSCHLDLEAVPEVGHECMVLLPALIDVFDQLLGPLLQDLNARVQR